MCYSCIWPQHLSPSHSPLSLWWMTFLIPKHKANMISWFPKLISPGTHYYQSTTHRNDWQVGEPSTDCSSLDPNHCLVPPSEPQQPPFCSSALQFSKWKPPDSSVTSILDHFALCVSWQDGMFIAFIWLPAANSIKCDMKSNFGFIWIPWITVSQISLAQNICWSRFQI